MCALQYAPPTYGNWLTVRLLLLERTSLQGVRDAFNEKHGPSMFERTWQLRRKAKLAGNAIEQIKAAQTERLQSLSALT